MPSISIDTFFACTLMVAVVLISTVLSSGILTSHMNSLQGLNQEEYFQAISQYIVSSTGTPSDWGSNSTTVPVAFGLARSDSLYTNELDIDKVCRLNTQNAFALTYLETLNAARLKNIALSISLSQLIDISINPVSNLTSGNSTDYNFKIYTTMDGAPVQTSLHYYAVAKDFLYNASNLTSNDGTSQIEIQIPNSSSGNASLIIFARADYDPRITAYGAYSFGLISPEPTPNETSVEMSPLNYTLSTTLVDVNTTLDKCYALSYGYFSNLSPTSNTTYQIPRIIDNSPVVLVISGSNSQGNFTEWTSYPQTPFKTGADFKNSASYSFSYIVTIKNTLYKLTLSFGGNGQ
jgi:hypothetical protein